MLNVFHTLKPYGNVKRKCFLCNYWYNVLAYVDMSSVQLSIDAVGEDFMDKYLNQESDPNEVNSRNLVLGTLKIITYVILDY